MFSDDKYDGQGELIEKNGSRYSGMFRDGRKEGQGILIDHKGKIKKGDWRKDKFVK